MACALATACGSAAVSAPVDPPSAPPVAAEATAAPVDSASATAAPAAPSPGGCRASSGAAGGWVKRIEGSDSRDSVRGLAVDLAGNVTTTGVSYEALDFGVSRLSPGPSAHIFIARFDATGAPLWAKDFADSDGRNDLDVRGVVADSACRVFIAGTFGGVVDFGGGRLQSAGGRDVFVASFDASGAHLWSKHYGDANDQAATGIAVDAAGNVAVAGWYEGRMDIGATVLSAARGDAREAFVFGFEGTGSTYWSRRFPASGASESDAIAFDGERNVVVAGHFVGTLNVGATALKSAGDSDSFVVKLSPAAEPIWAVRSGDVSFQRPLGVAAARTGEVLLVERAPGFSVPSQRLTRPFAHNLWLAKYEADGKLAWRKLLESAQSVEDVQNVAFDAKGHAIAAGDFEEKVGFGVAPMRNEGERDVFVASFDGSGTARSSQRFGSAGRRTEARGVAVDANGRVAFAAAVSGPTRAARALVIERVAP